MFNRFSSPILRAPEGDPAGGGGDPKTALSDEMRKEIGAMISGAFKAEGKRAIGAAVAEGLKGINWKETIAPAFQELVAELPDDPPGDDPPGDKPPNKPDPKIAALEAKLAALEAKNKEDAEALKKAQEAARDKDALAALKSALTPLVRPEALDIAASHLFVAEKRVAYDDQGNPLLTVRRPAYAGGPEEDVQMPLTDGVQHWVKSAQGKFFAPAPGGGEQPRGGGAPRRVNAGADGMPKYDTPATTDTERQRRIAERTEAIRARHPELK